MRKIIQERTMFKILIERTGALFSVTTRDRAYFFFLSAPLIGLRVAPTTDPYPGIVEACNYDISSIVRHWRTLANVKITSKTKLRPDTTSTLSLFNEPEHERPPQTPADMGAAKPA